MNDLIRKVDASVRRLSPASRRWRRFLRSLPIDLEAIDESLMEPGDRDFIICGCARTGTSLMSANLFQPPAIVTVMEPWDGMRLAPAELFASLREEIARTGQLARGRLDLDALALDREVQWVRDGEAARGVELAPDYMLGVKWPVFWRYLDLLPNTRFVVCLRNPFAVINSFKEAGGRLAMGLHYDTPFNRAMNTHLESATSDLSIRRIQLFDYVHERILRYLDQPNVLAVRYERWFEDPDPLVMEISSFLGVPLGKGSATIRPGKPLLLTDEEMDSIRQHCSTAGALGYDLSTHAGVAR